MKQLLQEKILQPCVRLLKQGVTPREILLTLVLGLAASVFPIAGIPTLLCTVFAIALRLNLPLIQGVNYMAAPLQWALIIPFIRVGEVLAGAPPASISPAVWMASFREGFLAAFSELADVALYAAMGWLVVVPLLACFVYALGSTALTLRRPSPVTRRA